jgi:hypothetical protein
MVSDKILQRIQSQINELAPILELFVHDNIQPSVQDCEGLQKQLTILQENLAVYKYNKQNKELSPSFNIHAKLSAASVEEEKKHEIAKEIKETIKLEVEEKDELKTLKQEIQKPEPTKVEAVKPETTRSKQSFSIGLNDKFRFINELFSQNSSEYHIALEQLNNVNSWNEAEIYLNSLKNVYEWKDNAEVVKYFYSLVKKRFD